MKSVLCAFLLGATTLGYAQDAKKVDTKEKSTTEMSMQEIKTMISEIDPALLGERSALYGLKNAFGKSGSNRAELIKAVKNAPNSQERQAVIFLINYMPERDLLTLKADFILENVKWAFKARNEFSWCKKLPMQIFFNDVLPHAILNERRDNWRQDFYNRFAPMVKDCTDMGEAIKVVNAAIKDELKVKYSTKRKKADQSPYESMELGLASCSGLSILLTDAFRAVGIPSRVVGVPMWTARAGNHNWCEVWIDGQWHFTEYYPDKNGLDHGWLLAEAGKAKSDDWKYRIYASSYLPTEYWFPLVWDFSIRFIYGVDVTNRYVDLAKKQNVVKNKKLVSFSCYDNNNKRLAEKITVHKKSDNSEVFAGTTSGPLADMNNLLSSDKFKVGESYIVKYADKTVEFIVEKGAAIQIIKLNK